MNRDNTESIKVPRYQTELNYYHQLKHAVSYLLPTISLQSVVQAEMRLRSQAATASMSDCNMSPQHVTTL